MECTFFARNHYQATGAVVNIHQYINAKRRHLELVHRQAAGITPITNLSFSPGSYLLVINAPGYADVRYPVSVNRGASSQINIDLLPESKVLTGLSTFRPVNSFGRNSGG